MGVAIDERVLMEEGRWEWVFRYVRRVLGERRISSRWLRRIGGVMDRRRVEVAVWSSGVDSGARGLSGSFVDEKL